MVKTHYHDSPDLEEDSVEAYGNCVLSLYDGIGCVAYDIKDKFIPLGCTKYIALEPNPDLKTLQQKLIPASPLN